MFPQEASGAVLPVATAKSAVKREKPADTARVPEMIDLTQDAAALQQQQQQQQQEPMDLRLPAKASDDVTPSTSQDTSQSGELKTVVSLNSF